MAGEHLVRLLQIAGAALGIPAAAAGTFAAYQNYFSTDVTCQKLRNDIIGIMERNVPPETKRSLLKKEVTEFDKLCGERDPEARVIFQAAFANFAPRAPSKVDFHKDDRPPLLIIGNGEDHTVPASVSKEAAKRFGRSKAVVDYKEFPGRPHFTAGAPGWEEVADYALEWATRHTGAPAEREEPVTA